MRNLSWHKKETHRKRSLPFRRQVTEKFGPSGVPSKCGMDRRPKVVRKKIWELKVLVIHTFKEAFAETLDCRTCSLQNCSFKIWREEGGLHRKASQTHRNNCEAIKTQRFWSDNNPHFWDDSSKFVISAKNLRARPCDYYQCLWWNPLQRYHHLYKVRKKRHFGGPRQPKIQKSETYLHVDRGCQHLEKIVSDGWCIGINYNRDRGILKN